MEIETYTNTYNTVELDKVLYHFEGFPPLSEEEPEPVVTPEVMVDTKIYTDGEIIRVVESSKEPISEYFIGKIKYDRPVDTLIKRKAYVKNASYILVVTVAEDKVRIGTHGVGFFDVIKDTEIFLNNKKDKKALKKARETLMAISGSSHYDNIFAALFRKNSTSNDLDYEKANDSVYTLKK